MKYSYSLGLAAFACVAWIFSSGSSADEPKPLRIGIIGCDTSHVPAFTNSINGPQAKPEFAGMRVVAAYPGGSDDIPDSISRVPMYTEELRKGGVEIVDSIPALLERVDAVMLESLDGRKHLPQARPVIEAGKPLYIDKPMGGNLAEAIEIFRLAKEKNVPCFSSSSLRFSPGIAGMVGNPAIGDVLGCDAFSPCSLEPHHPDLFWYGVHGVEILFTIMGPGCQTVARTHTDDSEFVVGVWKDGRVGTFRGNRKGAHSYGAMVFGSKAIQRSGDFGGYEPLVVEIAKFFRTLKPPVSPEETIEIMAFMQAADEKKQQGGKPINVEQLIEKARQAGGAAKQAAAPGLWKAGVASAVITPEQPMLMGGYAARSQPAEGKLNDLAAKALVLEDASGRRAVLVTMDIVSIGRQFAAEVCGRIEQQYSIPRPAVALSVSHNHCGPLIKGNLGDIMFDLDDAQRNLVDRYNSGLTDRVVKLVGDAIGNLAPAQVSTATGSATFAVNRRNNREPEVPQRRAEGRLVGPVDHEVPVLRVADAAGNLRAIVFGYACHATTLNTPVWSSDWPGAGQAELERRHPGTLALFCAGCGADQNPLPRLKEEFLAIYGGQIADAVDRALAAPLQTISPQLAVAFQEIELPFAQLPSREQLESQAAGTSGTPFEKRRAKLLLAAWDRDGQLSPTYPYPLQLWRLGSELDWLFLGGEVVVDYSLRLKRSAGATPLWVTAYSNDVLAYIPSRRVLAEGGYEGGGAMVYFGLPSPWDPSVEERIIDAAGRLRGQLAAAR